MPKFTTRENFMERQKREYFPNVSFIIVFPSSDACLTNLNELETIFVEDDVSQTVLINEIFRPGVLTQNIDVNMKT